MKVFISADMEGTTGITNKVELMAGMPEYERFRKLMTGDVNAAVAGAFDAGATEVLVNDSHSTMRNILIEQLDSRAELISGHTKPQCMMEGLDETFDAVVFTGYHSRVGTQVGVGNHTMYGREVNGILLNDRPVGEIAINAAIAGHYNVPVVMIAGDDAATKEAREYLGEVETVAVKSGIDRWTAKCLTPSASGKLIREATAKALANLSRFQPFKVTTPVKFELELFSTPEAAVASYIPTAVRTGPRSVSLTGDDILSAYRAMLAALMLAASVSDDIYG
ncbi:MAG: M55 family metallopeptidase [Chloroflexi bacterium]|nr:M55 family metallopeptidase [Chloroflexota bacterium]